MKKVNLLGINLSTLNSQQIYQQIENFLIDNKQHYIVTVNPEFILTAQADEEFFYLLNQADLAIVDGAGLKIAGWLVDKNLTRITGADLVEQLLILAQRSGKKVAIAVWSQGLSSPEEIEHSLKQKYPKLNFFVQSVEREAGQEINQLQSLAAEILFVNLGAPWQEKFIYHNLAKLPTVKLAVGVGGSFDYLTGKIQRAPKFLRILGLEWLWRLAKQPWRWERIYRAVIVFSYKFFIWRYVQPLLYRPNVVCLLYKKESRRATTNDAHLPAQEGVNNKEAIYKILITERLDEPGHWQLPQGGTDDQNLIRAGQRELSEEISTDKFRALATFKNLWKYKWDKNIKITKRRNGYRGQKQGLFIAEFLGQDSDIKVNFWEHRGWKWVEQEKLVEAVHAVRKQATKIFLEKFEQTVKS